MTDGSKEKWRRCAERSIVFTVLVELNVALNCVPERATPPFGGVVGLGGLNAMSDGSTCLPQDYSTILNLRK